MKFGLMLPNKGRLYGDAQRLLDLAILAEEFGMGGRLHLGSYWRLEKFSHRGSLGHFRCYCQSHLQDATWNHDHPSFPPETLESRSGNCHAGSPFTG